MIKALAVIALLQVGTVACSEGSNQEACLAYIETINALPCVTGDLRRPDAFCDDFKQLSCQMNDYFTCLTDHATCDGATLDISGQTRCAAMAICT